MMGSRSFRRKAAIPMFHDINGDQSKSYDGIEIALRHGLPRLVETAG
jgi:hypothetical protein